MPIHSLFAIYNNQYGSFYSDFTCCSFDKINGVSVVSDSRNCFCFDDIRNRDFNINGLKTTDSLYFAFNSSCIIFVEFKNTKVKKDVQKDIAVKAADTLFIHNVICNQNGFAISSVPIYYLAVYYYGKNTHILSRTAVILARSGRGASLSTLTSSLYRKYLSELSNKHPSIPNLYVGFEILLSDSFSRKITLMD